MQACVKVITPASGTATQTFTGFNDKVGAPFTPKVFIPIGVAPKDSVGTLWSWSLGIDDGTTHFGETCNADNEVGLKGCAAGSSGDYSILKFHDTLSFGGQFYNEALITAIRSGEIDVKFDLNNSPGDSYILVALGGDELDYSIIYTNAAGTFTPGFETVALIDKIQRLSSGTVTGGGSLAYSMGFATKSDAHSGALSSLVCGGDISAGDNARYQGTDNLFSELNGGFLQPLGSFGRSNKTLSAWGSTTFALAGSTIPTATLALGGIQATSGTWQEPATDSTIDIDTTIDRKLMLFISSGQTGFGSIGTGTAEVLVGLYDCVNNISFWTGENYVGDNGFALRGARTISSSQAIQFATPNGGSTTFANKATAALLGDTSVQLTFTNTDGTQRSGLWLALGDVVAPPAPPPNPPTPVSIHRRSKWGLLRFDTKTRLEETS